MELERRKHDVYYSIKQEKAQPHVPKCSQIRTEQVDVK